MMNLDPRLQNKWWRLTHLYKIRDKQGRIVTFNPNIIQLKYLAHRGSHRRNLIVKFRQGGFTTLHCIDYLDESLWIPGMTCAILSHEREASDKIFDIVKRAYVNFPDALKPRTKTDTKRMYEFTHRFDGMVLDSSIYVAMKLRAGTVYKLHITESARIKDRLELDAGSKQAVPVEGWITEETTGNGFDVFYDSYMEALARKDPKSIEYKSYFYAWVEDPEYTLPGSLEAYMQSEEEIRRIAREQLKIDVTDGQLLWRRWKMDELKRKDEGSGLTGEQLFKQEYPLTITEAFQSGAGNVFSTEKLDSLSPSDPISLDDGIAKLTDPAQQERFRALMQLGIRFWRFPEPGRKYDVGVDPSDGEGADSSCIDIWEKEDTEQCAQYYGKIRPDELAEMTAMLAEFYNHAFVGVENNMLSTILFLSKIYDNYYYEVKFDERTQRRTKKLGWSTNVKTRDVMIDDFIIFYDEDHLKIHSGITIREMKTFVKKDNGKREHADGKHDDSLFAAFVALQMRKFDMPRARGFVKQSVNI